MYSTSKEEMLNILHSIPHKQRNTQTGGPWSFWSLRDQPTLLKNIQKAADRVQINTCKTATLVLKGQRLKVHLKKD